MDRLTGGCEFGCGVFLEVAKRVDEALWDREELDLNKRFIAECVRDGNNRVKLRGKYAFLRILHCQEVVSSLFSAMCAVCAMYFAARARGMGGKGKGGGGYLRGVFWVFVVQGFGWGCSAVFHFRDCYCTQCFDYFSCVFGILSVACLSAYRNRRGFFISVLGSVVFLIFHIWYMVFVEFDFLYNSVACGAILCGVLTYWSAWYVRIRRSSHSALLKLSIFGIGVASSFQAIDYGPILFLIDSHALFHILMLVFSYVLYSFLLADLHLYMDKKRSEKDPKGEVVGCRSGEVIGCRSSEVVA